METVETGTSGSEPQRSEAQLGPDAGVSATGQREQRLAAALRIGLLGLFVWMVRDLLMPIALGGLIALLLHPLQRRLASRLGRHAGVAPALLTASAVVLVVIPAGLLAGKTVASINQFLDRDWAAASGSVQTFIAEKSGPLRAHLGIDGAQLKTGAENVVRHVGTVVAGVAGDFAKGLPGQVVDLFLFLLSLYYFLRDGSALSRWLGRISPFPDVDTKELFASIHDTVHGAVLGVLATAAVQGALTMIVLFALRVPGALLFGILATLLAFIPMVGTAPVTVGAAIYLLAVGRTGAAAIMAVAALVIGVADNIVRPWVQTASSDRLHPLLALLGIFGGLGLFGASGVFLGPVVAGMAVWTVHGYAELRAAQTDRRPA